MGYFDKLAINKNRARGGWERRAKLARAELVEGRANQLQFDIFYKALASMNWKDDGGVVKKSFC